MGLSRLRLSLLLTLFIWSASAQARRAQCIEDYVLSITSNQDGIFITDPGKLPEGFEASRYVETLKRSRALTEKIGPAWDVEIEVVNDMILFPGYDAIADKVITDAALRGPDGKLRSQKHAEVVLAHEYAHSIFEQAMENQSPIWKRYRQEIAQSWNEYKRKLDAYEDLKTKAPAEKASDAYRAWEKELAEAESAMTKAENAMDIHKKRFNVMSSYHELFADLLPAIQFRNPKVIYNAIKTPNAKPKVKRIEQGRDLSVQYGPRRLRAWKQDLLTEDMRYLSLAPTRSKIWSIIGDALKQKTIDEQGLVEELFNAIKTDFEQRFGSGNAFDGPIDFQKWNEEFKLDGLGQGRLATGSQTPSRIEDDLVALSGRSPQDLIPLIEETKRLSRNLEFPESLPIVLRSQGRAPQYDFAGNIRGMLAFEKSELEYFAKKRRDPDKAIKSGDSYLSHPKYTNALIVHELGHAIFETTLTQRSKAWNELGDEIRVLNKKLEEAGRAYSEHLKQKPDVSDPAHGDWKKRTQELSGEKQKLAEKKQVAVVFALSYHELFADILPVLQFKDPRIIYKAIHAKSNPVDTRIQFKYRDFTYSYGAANSERWLKDVRDRASNNPYSSLAPARTAFWEAVEQKVKVGSVDSSAILEQAFSVIQRDIEENLAKGILKNSMIKVKDWNEGLIEKFKEMKLD